MKRRTVSADDLETMAFAAHAPIEPPGPGGGWATATINGREYRARVVPVPVRCQAVCRIGWPSQCVLPDGHDAPHSYALPVPEETP